MPGTVPPLVMPLGMLEWDSIADGLAATDALLKEAPVEAILIRPVSPGRFTALFTGEVEAVRASLRRGLEVRPSSILDSLFLPKPHPGLVPAIGARAKVGEVDAVAILETATLCSLLVAADAAAKTGSVELLEIRLGMGLGGKAFAVWTGEVSQVEAALERAKELASERGRYLRSALIPRPDPRLALHFAEPPSPFADYLV